MQDILNLKIGTYKIGTIINGDENTIAIGDKLEPILSYFKKIREQYINNKNHVIIYVFDYDKNTNIEYYDNQIEIL